MLTGRRAFEGKSSASLIGAILKDEPPPVSTLQPIAFPALDRVVSRCLAKNRDDRWQTARDLLAELRWVGATPRGSAAIGAVPIRRSRTPWILVAALSAVLVASGVIVARHLRESPPPRNVIRFQTAVSSITGGGGSVAISPDGRQVAFVANAPADRTLWLRSIDSADLRQVPAVRQPGQIAWSPDSRRIVFSTDRSLRTVDISAGTVQTLGDYPGTLSGLAWGPDEAIVLGVVDAGETSGLLMVDARSGATRSFVIAKEDRLFQPAFADAGRLVAYLAQVGRNLNLCAVRRSGERVGCTALAADAIRLSGSGHLVFSRGATLFAQRFDARSVTLAGEPMPVAEQVAGNIAGQAFFAVTGGADAPVLAYFSGASQQDSQFAWLDRSGRRLGDVGEPSNYQGFDLSPDGRFIIASRIGSGNSSAWVIDVSRGVATRASTPETDMRGDVVWAPDGRRFAFLSARQEAIYEQPAFGGPPRLLKRYTEGRILGLEDWSRDGRFLATLVQPGAERRGEAQPADGSEPVVLARGSGLIDELRFSPDGRWAAYNSNESGRHEVYIAPMPPTGERWQVSTSGGAQGRWRGDSRELYYLALDGTMMVVPIGSGATPAIGAPVALFKVGFAPTYNIDHFSPTADGQRFLVKTSAAGREESLLNVIVNWTSALPK